MSRTRVHALYSAIGALLLALPAMLLAETRIGYVNAGRVTSDAPQADAARAQLEEEFGPRDQELSDLQQKITELEDQLNRDGAVLSEEDQQRQQRELVARQRELRRAEEEFREDFNMRRNEELGRLQRRIVDTINVVAEEQEFDLIVSEGVIYASDRVDITETVLERLQREHEADQ